MAFIATYASSTLFYPYAKTSDGECSRILPHKRILEATSKSRLCNHKSPEIERFQDFYLYCNHYASFIPGRKVAIQLFDPGRIIRMLQQEMVDSLCQCQ